MKTEGEDTWLIRQAWEARSAIAVDGYADMPVRRAEDSVAWVREA